MSCSSALPYCSAASSEASPYAAASAVAAAEAGGFGRGDADALFDELLQPRSQGLRMPGSDPVAVTAVVDGILRWQADALGQSNGQSCGAATCLLFTSSDADE